MENRSEDNNIGGRMRRYARGSTAVGGIAARMAGERYLGMKLDKSKHAEDLRMALGGLKGPLMKVAQILSTIPEGLPREYAAELTHLQSNAPSMGWPFVKRRMASELGQDWQKKFQSFEKQAVAAASLGQVHRAVGHDGANLACKLQYPDMSSAVEADLKQLKVVFSLYRRYDQAIDPTKIYEELSDRLREELDYTREARHMALYADMLKGEANVAVPETVQDLSTTRLLTMTWLSGERLLDFVDEAPERRNEVARSMFRAWYVPFYQYGVIHGDPHLGSYTVRPDDCGVNLIVVGVVRIFPPHFVSGVIDLYRALLSEDEELAVHAYETWGFTNLSREIIDVLNIWARFVYGPIMEDRVRTMEETNNVAYGAEVAEKFHAALKEIGGVQPPREFILMDRAAIGLGSVFLHLKAELNWFQMVHDLIENFEVASMQERQAAALSKHGLEPLN